MSMHISSGEDDEMLSTINTTPLVDVMLVLLIIFLITIPVVTQTVPVSLPKERSQPREQQASRIAISVTREGEIFWGLAPIKSPEELVRRLKTESTRVPQPEVSIRGDEASRYERIDRVVRACRRAGITKVGFVIEPAARGH